MKKKQQLTITFILFIIGFMVAVQFQTTQEPVVRDTRDIWELREDYKKAQQKHRELLSEIHKYDQLLAGYEENSASSKEKTLKETKEELERKIGLTEVEGPGIVLTIEPLYSDQIPGEPYQTVTPQLLQRLINELNSYGAGAIAIDGKRITASSPIRDVNGQTHVNTKRLKPLPIEIKVLAADKSKKAAKKLHDQMTVSQSADDFALDGLMLITTAVDYVKLPAYDETIRIKNMEPADSQKEDA
ncbi:DUF881 domain-containing protein [Bacillus marinisedimentorum]|uniref:DUF881 domain-containing protein n=1 Tax=Bacillus marinisedimentorum TaxID=1821260 RepID=UPI0009F2201A|nr:DUF881 domain-containing protein [Bacillus marinisedimentorum]